MGLVGYAYELVCEEGGASAVVGVDGGSGVEKFCEAYGVGAFVAEAQLAHALGSGQEGVECDSDTECGFYDCGSHCCSVSISCLRSQRSIRPG